jgi:hypothetical protein
LNKQLVNDFVAELHDQIEADKQRWGNTWQKRTHIDQEARIKERYDAYFDQFFNAGVPVPWLKIAALALIGWVRDNVEDWQTGDYA